MECLNNDYQNMCLMVTDLEVAFIYPAGSSRFTVANWWTLP